MSPLRALVHAFLGRFFENESTLGRTDLRESFLRLIGMLAAPAMFWAFWQSFRWDLIVRARGIEGLHVAVLYDKTLFLTFTYVAVGMLACLVWPSLVVDRRDGLVLGVLPVRLRTIVVAKLGAVFGYIGLISGGMHVGASAMFGTFLSGGHPLSLVRGIAGHFIAMCGVALFTFLSMSALAAMGLAIFGPRRFSRISGSLQIVCVAIVTAGLAMFPIVTGRVVPVLTGADPGHSWIVYTPPIWFLGLYETIAGTTLPIMSGLARTAVIALAIAVTTLAAFYPIGCARVLASAAPVKPFARRWSSRLTETMVRLLAGDGPVRGALQFAMATIGRVQQHRLTIAMAVGIFLTFAVPLTLSRLSPAEAMPRRSFLLPHARDGAAADVPAVGRGARRARAAGGARRALAVQGRAVASDGRPRRGSAVDLSRRRGAGGGPLSRRRPVVPRSPGRRAERRRRGLLGRDPHGHPSLGICVGAVRAADRARIGQPAVAMAVVPRRALRHGGRHSRSHCVQPARARSSD